MMLMQTQLMHTCQPQWAADRAHRTETYSVTPPGVTVPWWQEAVSTLGQVGLGPPALCKVRWLSCLSPLARQPPCPYVELCVSLANIMKHITEQRVTQNRKQRNHNAFSLAKKQQKKNHAVATTSE